MLKKPVNRYWIAKHKVQWITTTVDSSGELRKVFQVLLQR